MSAVRMNDCPDERWLADRALAVILRSGTGSPSVDVEVDLWRALVGAATHRPAGMVEVAVAVARRHGSGRPAAQLRRDLRAALDVRPSLVAC